MIVTRRIPWRWTLFYIWPSLLLLVGVAGLVYGLRTGLGLRWLVIPIGPVAVLGTALSIFVGFNNNAAYDRWWEARKIWGLLVNYSRAWGRQVLTMIRAEGALRPAPPAVEDEVPAVAIRDRLIDRHIAFVHALRVFLRRSEGYPHERGAEIVTTGNHYSDIARLLSEAEYADVRQADNPPNRLLQLQGETLREALDRGWIDSYLFATLDATLIEFNNIQGRCERIKNTPLPRPYSYHSRFLIHLQGIMLPLALVGELGWAVIPISFIINLAFLILDMIGKRIEDPFENRMDDTPMSSLSRTIEGNLREQQGRPHDKPKLEQVEGVVF